ncbi:MAG: hypothetical protein ACYDGR_05140 [Candidatus Dormibacteria bacterium]
MSELINSLIMAPTGRHLDLWGGVLIALASVSLVTGILGFTRLHQLWRRHPYKLLIGSMVTRAVLGIGLFLLVAAVAHTQGWPVYGTPLFGLIGLLMLGAALAWTAAFWALRLRSLLQRYEKRYPEVISGTANIAPARMPHIEMPYLLMPLGGFIAYAAFIWHPWSHLFHEPNWLLGAPVGYAVGNLIGLARYGVPPGPTLIQRPTRAAPNKRR